MAIAPYARRLALAPLLLWSVLGSAQNVGSQAVERRVLPESGTKGNLAAEPARAVESLDGSGTVVAIAGSGIDYTHVALGGLGDPDEYASNDPSVVETGSFPTDRVVGGVDLAGRWYSASCPDPVPADVRCSASPSPDDDPLDSASGQGTALAGIVAREAPGASLVAIDILGSPIGVPAASDLHAEAIEWVLQHNRGERVPGHAPDGRIDVLLFQAGGAFGAGPPGLERLIDQAAASGVVVIAPVGDSGNVPFSANAPASSARALAVGAAHGDDDSTWGIRAVWPDGDGEVVLEAEALDAAPPFASVAETQAFTSTLAWYGEACSEDGQPSAPAQDVAEKIALVERGTCTFVEKVNNAQAMGAVAALLFSDSRDKIRPQGGGGNPPTIPSLMIDRGPGLELRRLVEEGKYVQIRVDPEYRVAMAGLMSAVSARGPSRAGGVAPDVIADGVNVSVPVAGSGSGMATVNGSAPAAASVAALAARLAQRRNEDALDLDGGQLAAWIASHAMPSGRTSDGFRAGVDRQGAGFVDAAVVLGANTFVASAVATGMKGASVTGPAGIDLGAPRIGDLNGAETAVRLPVRNLGGNTKHFDISVKLGDRTPAGVDVMVPQGRLVVAPDGESFLQVKVAFDPTALSPWDLNDGRAIRDVERLAASTFDGWVTLTEVGDGGAPLPNGERLVVPVRAVPRPGACVVPGTAIESPSDAGEQWMAMLPLVNQCAGEGAVRVAFLSGTDPAESDKPVAEDLGPLTHPAALDILAVGMSFGPAAEVQPDEPDERVDGNGTWLLEWHVLTSGPRMVAPEAAIDVLLDFDQDGRFDRALTTVHGPDWRGGYAAGDWLVLNTPLIPGTLQPDITRALPNPLPLVWDIDERVTTLTARAEELLIDLPSGQERFGYAVRLRDAFGDFPRNSVFPGYDDAPDGLVSGEQYTFVQDEVACVEVRDASGTRIDRAGTSLYVDAMSPSRLDAFMSAGCEARGDVALLVSFPVNIRGAPAAYIWPLHFRSQMIYVPYAYRQR